MAWFEVDFKYDIEEYDTVLLEADSKEEADHMGWDYIRDTYPEVKNIVIDDVKEVIR